MSSKTISLVFTGGGTAGHVVPCFPLIEHFQKMGWRVTYFGSPNSIEQRLIQARSIPFYSIATGKFRRYFSWKNFSDPFKILCGIVQAIYYLRKSRPQLVFSKGGYVAFPVVVAAWLNRIPVITHESDLTPGLANRLMARFAKTVCLSFPETATHFSANTSVAYTGNPVRPQLLHGDRKRGLADLGFDENKPVLLVMGGGSGALELNTFVFKNLPILLKSFQVIHLVGRGGTSLIKSKGYRAFEYVDDPLADYMACAHIILSRAGANSPFELLALKKPHILVPLSTQASRGDQLQNACYFKEKGYSEVVFSEDINTELLPTLHRVLSNLKTIKDSLEEHSLPNANEKIIELIIGSIQST